MDKNKKIFYVTLILFLLSKIHSNNSLEKINKEIQFIISKQNELNNNIISENEKKQINKFNEILDDQVSIPQNQVSITYTELYDLKQGKLVIESKTREVRVIAEDGGIGFTSLTKAIYALNKSIEDNNVTHIGLLQIVLGHGQTWVVEGPNRTLIGPGCAYSSALYTLEIGRPLTDIQNIRIIGAGQGASTLRGSFILNIWNLQELGVFSVEENNQTNINKQDPETDSAPNINEQKEISNTQNDIFADLITPNLIGLTDQTASSTAQFDLQLLLQNFFLSGWLGINIKYSEQLPGMAAPEIENYDIYDKRKNRYKDILQGNLKAASAESIKKWRSRRSVEVLMMNVWIQLSEPPLGTDKDGNYKPVLKDHCLMVPLFFLNIPSLYRIFISSCNWISYIKPKALSPDSSVYGNEGCPPSLVQINSQFLNLDGVTDTFLQLCSFSCREFGPPNREFSSLTLNGNDKVSIADCQFSGRAILQCNKIAALGCYFLGTGILPGDDDDKTTHALVMLPPDWYYDPSAERFTLLSGPRLIISGCQFVTLTKQIWTYSQINNDLNLLPFSYKKWNESSVIQTLDKLGKGSLNIQFNNTTFYMVAPEDINDYSKGFKFQPIELTNLPKVEQIITNPDLLRKL